MEFCTDWIVGVGCGFADGYFSQIKTGLES